MQRFLSALAGVASWVGTVRRAAGGFDYQLDMGGTMSGSMRENCSESGPVSEARAEFGVLFVAGFAEQRPGTAIAAFAGAIYRWLFRWNAGSNLGLASPPALSETVLTSAPGTAGGPAHAELAARMHLSTGEHEARWLLAESSWADLFTPPRFLGSNA